MKFQFVNDGEFPYICEIDTANPQFPILGTNFNTAKNMLVTEIEERIAHYQGILEEAKQMKEEQFKSKREICG